MKLTRDLAKPLGKFMWQWDMWSLNMVIKHKWFSKIYWFFKTKFIWVLIFDKKDHKVYKLNRITRKKENTGAVFV